MKTTQELRGSIQNESTSMGKGRTSLLITKESRLQITTQTHTMITLNTLFRLVYSALTLYLFCVFSLQLSLHNGKLTHTRVQDIYYL